MQDTPHPEAAREAVLPAVLEGRVVSAGGEPVAGALVTWTALTPLDLEWEPAWQEDDWGELEREELEATSDEHGAFRFAAAPEESSGSILWATHPLHLAGCVVRGPLEPLVPVEIELERHAPMTVRVVGGDGTAVAGAQVHQFGSTPAQAPRGEHGRTPERARRLLHRRSLTDAAGIAQVGPFPGDQVLVASTAAERSMPWRGPACAEVVLRLESSFTIGGTAFFPDWSDLDYEGERRLVVELVRGHTANVLACLRPMLEGEWGPIELPRLEGARYALRLEGSPIVPLHREFDAPGRGEHLAFELVAEVGHELWFWAEDEQGKVLLDAEITCHYEHEGRERVLRRRVRTDGFLNPWSFPAGVVVRSFVSAPGRAGVWTQEIAVPEANPGTHRIVLERATSLHGRVTHAGAPVQDFDVVVWKPPRTRYTQFARSFLGREDGTFEIDGVPVGRIAVAASSGIHPLGEPVFLSAPSADPVELELFTTLLGRGQVVDLENGEAVEDAEVQAFSTVTEGLLRPWGRPVHTDREGRFELAAFAARGNCIRIRAQGFAERTAFASASSSERVDFGRITLFRPQSLEVRLVSDDSVDFTAYTASAARDVVLPTRRFDETGLVRYEKVEPGVCLVKIEGPGFPWLMKWLVLEPGKPWSFSQRVNGGKRLDVEIVAPEGHDLRRYIGLYVSYLTHEGSPVEWGFPMPQDGHFSMEGIDADSVLVGLPTREASGIEVQAMGLPTPSGELFARIDLDAEEFVLRVVDGEGAPLAGVLVRMTDTQPTPLLLARTTDGNGACTFRGVPQRELLVHLDHDRFGRSYQRRVDTRPGEAEIVLEADRRIELLLRDGEAPAAGVLAKVLVTPIGPRWTPLGISDASGRVSADGFGEGVYSVVLEHPDYWPRTAEAAATHGEAPLEVQIRRRGSALFQLRTEEGLPITGAALQLVSSEFETDVDDWLEQGLASGSQGLVSDLKGEVRVERVPHGSYTWSTRASDGSRLEGHCEVPAGELLRLPIVVP